MTWISCLSVNSQQPLNWKRFFITKISKLHLILIQLKSDSSRATVFDIKKKSRQYNSLDRRRTSNITMETKLGNLQYFIPYSIIFRFLCFVSLFFWEYNNQNYFYAMQYKKNWSFFFLLKVVWQTKKKVFYSFEFEWVNIIAANGILRNNLPCTTLQIQARAVKWTLRYGR